jgi:hypothetical protein
MIDLEKFIDLRRREEIFERATSMLFLERKDRSNTLERNTKNAQQVTFQ